MKAKLFALIVTAGLFFTLFATVRDEYVYAAGEDPCNNSCPVGTVCEQTGPSTWTCASDGSGGGTDPNPEPVAACGDAAAPSCNGGCESGSSCVTTEAKPNCHCKASGGGAPMCAVGQVLLGYNPQGYLNLASCQYMGTCWSYFPSSHQITGCDGVATKGICSVSYLCCNPGETIACTTAASDTYEILATACPAGEMKVSARTSHYFTKDGERISQLYVTCRRNCGCVPSCNATAPTGISIVQGAG